MLLLLGDMNSMQYLYKEIQGIDKSGITMSDGYKLSFEECNQTWRCMKNAEESKCAGERDITADCLYFRFYRKPVCTKNGIKNDANDITEILFIGKGLRKRWQSQKAFLNLQHQISQLGYTTYDLS